MDCLPEGNELGPTEIHLNDARAISRTLWFFI
jgi:hypothetical protein